MLFTNFRLIEIISHYAINMSSWPELKSMPNNLVNYGVTDNGIAIIELISDTDGKPLSDGRTSVNTYTREMWEDIDQAILSARFDGNVSVILLTGHGEKFFSAGASINYLNTLSPRYKYFFCLHANETLSRLEQTPKLVIAALNGHTVGGGLEIAMAADIRIAHKGNFQIGLPEVSLGVLAGTGGTARLARLVGKARAMEIMVTGRKFSFEEARDMDLIHDIYDSVGLEDFRTDVLDYAGQFTLPLAAAKAIGNIKRSVQSGIEIPLEYHLALERELQSDLFQSEDAKEGIASYVERRTPRFKGE
jgi:enoyl-CoA hydratase/carnithine racemase|tara:strand:+ start:829 stop:1743 length:915 start_codon:yes stop_codon:yes gene_type:complete